MQITYLYNNAPLSLAFILPHSPLSNASLAAATARSTSAGPAHCTYKFCKINNKNIKIVK